VIAGRRIGVMGDAAETNKTLHNWMGEPRPRSSDQRDEEETLQLSLGLPGGGASAGGGVAPAAWRMLPARDEEMRSAAAVVDTSLLSLGYSAPAFSPRSPGMNASAVLSSQYIQVKL
jgi:auxin-responsive protein IAA